MLFGKLSQILFALVLPFSLRFIFSSDFCCFCCCRPFPLTLIFISALFICSSQRLLLLIFARTVTTANVCVQCACTCLPTRSHSMVGGLSESLCLHYLHSVHVQSCNDVAMWTGSVTRNRPVLTIFLCAQKFFFFADSEKCKISSFCSSLFRAQHKLDEREFEMHLAEEKSQSGSPRGSKRTRGGGGKGPLRIRFVTIDSAR